MRFLADAQLFEVGSFTRPEIVYDVVLVKGGARDTCTCANFRFHGDKGPCKHIMAVYDALADDAFPELLKRGAGVPVDGSLVAEAFEAGFKMGQRGFVR
jgi:hypothetical protein